jgi:hypothetical protein
METLTNITIRQARLKLQLIAKREQLAAAADTPHGFHSGPQEHDMLDLELAHLEKECGQAQEELDRQDEAKLLLHADATPIHT